jgi:hypothetical protein
MENKGMAKSGFFTEMHKDLTDILGITFGLLNNIQDKTNEVTEDKEFQLYKEAIDKQPGAIQPTNEDIVTKYVDIHIKISAVNDRLKMLLEHLNTII